MGVINNYCVGGGGEIGGLKYFGVLFGVATFLKVHFSKYHLQKKNFVFVISTLST